uniref:Capsid protein n=1 Tax=Myotis mistacinus feces associated cyclovirus 3 TaxID=3139995 RepID=A0AAU6S5B0_9CIRC
MAFFPRRRRLFRRRPRYNLKRRYFRRRRRFMRSSRATTRHELSRGGQLFTRLHQSYILNSTTGRTIYLAPQLQSFTHYTNFAQFWSSIRVWKIAYKITPVITENVPIDNAGATYVLSFGRHVGSIYYDDQFPGAANTGVAQSYYDEISNFPNSKSTSITKPLRFSFVPKTVVNAVAVNGTITGKGWVARRKLDCDTSVGTSLYGLVYCYEGQQPESTNIQVRVDCYIYATFYEYRQFQYSPTVDKIDLNKMDINKIDDKKTFM